MKAILIALALLVPASIASAQTHPCDITPTPNIRITKTSVVVGFCHDLKDNDGTPYPGAGSITFAVLLDTTRVLTGVSLQPQGAPSASGYYYFEFAAITVAKGSHSVVVGTTDPDAEVLSDPYPFSVGGPGPKKPIKARARAITD